MDNRNVFYQQPNDLQGMELKIWESSEFQAFLVRKIGSDLYAQALHNMTGDKMKGYIKQFQIEQEEARQREKAEREEIEKLMQRPAQVDIDPVQYLNSNSFQNDIKLATSESKEGLEDAYNRLRAFLDKLQKLAPSMTIQQAKTFFSELEAVTNAQIKQIGMNKNVSGTLKATTPAKFTVALRSLRARLEQPDEPKKEEPKKEQIWLTKLPSSEEAMQTAQKKFFLIAEHGLLTGQDRKKLNVGASESVDAKSTISSVMPSDLVHVNIILGIRQADPVMILSSQIDDISKGWLHIALEDAEISIEDLYQKGASANELKAVCQHRVLNTMLCVMSLDSLTTNNAMIGLGPANLKSLIAERESPTNFQVRAKNRDRIHEGLLPSSIYPKGFVAILVPEALMGTAAMVAKFFVRQGLNVSFYAVPTITYYKKRGDTKEGGVEWNFAGPDYNSTLVEICELQAFKGKNVIFHCARLR